MKKKTAFLSFVVAAILITAGMYFSFHWRNGAAREESRKLLKASIGSEEDPGARARYEWMRLRDPATGQIPPKIRAKELEFAATLPTKEYLASVSRGKSGHIAAASVFNWSRRGPVNVGGRTRALAVDISNENILIGGGVSGGMWRSTDGGISWTKTTLSSDLHSVSCLAQDPRAGKTNVWYYGTGEYQGNSASGGAASYRGDGIFKSTDGGISWSQLAATASGTPQTFDQLFDYVWNIVTDPSNTSQDEVYAATYSAIYRSTNGGTTWSVVRGGSSPYSPYVDVAITSTGIVYATLSSEGSAKGIFRSTNGTTWTDITPAGWPSTYRRIVIGIAPSNENVVYFLAETAGSGLNNHSLWKYTYVSGDGSGSGGTWVNRSANLPAFGNPVGNFDSQGSYDLIVKVKPDNENVVFIGGTNLYRSTDGFATTPITRWIGGYSTANNISQYVNHHPDQHSVVFLPSNASILFSGHDGGVSKTTNNLASTVSWTSLNSGYFTTQFYTVAIDQSTSGNNVVIGGMQDNGTYFTNSSSGSEPWVNVYSGDGAFCAIADGRTSYYVSSQNGVVYRLILDDLGNYSDWTRVDPTGGSGYLFINPFVLDPTNSSVMYLAGGDRLWRNSNLVAIPLFSNSTTSVNWSSLSNTAVTGATIAAIGISKSPANRLYYGTDDGQVYRVDNANIGNPVASNIWTGKGFPAGAYVSHIAVDPTDGQKAIVVFSNYSVQSLFYTANGGTTWTAVSGNLEQNPDGTGNGPSVRWAAILPGSSTTFFVATSTGVYSTTTLSGASTVWALEGASTIGNVVADMIDSRQTDGLVVVGTHGGGVFSTNIVSLPAIPTLASPADGATGISTSPTLTWNPSTGASSYGLEVSTSPTFSTTVVNQTGITGTSQQVSGLASNTTHYWRVNGTNAAGTSDWSSARSFTTVSVLFGDASGNGSISAFDASLCLQHAVGLIVLTGTAFTAADVSGNGQVSAFDASLILQFVAGLITCFPADPSCPAVAKAAVATGSLGWVEAESAGSPELVILPVALKDAQNVISVQFSTQIDPTLVSVENVTAKLPEDWQMVYNVSGSELRVAMAGVTPVGAGEVAEIMLRVLNRETPVTLSGSGFINESTTQDFGDVRVRQIPTEYALHQNYPNPFNPTTQIRYQLREDSQVHLVIYNVMGQEVRTLVNGEDQEAGFYTIQWDGRNDAGVAVTSGVYLYRIQASTSSRQAGVFRAMKKMMLVK